MRERVDAGRTLALNDHRNAFAHVDTVGHLTCDVAVGIEADQFDLVGTGRTFGRKCICGSIVGHINDIVAVALTRSTDRKCTFHPSRRSDPQFQVRITDGISVVRERSDGDVRLLSGSEYRFVVIDSKYSPVKIIFVDIRIAAFFYLHMENIFAGMEVRFGIL